MATCTAIINKKVSDNKMFYVSKRVGVTCQETHSSRAAHPPLTSAKAVITTLRVPYWTAPKRANLP